MENSRIRILNDHFRTFLIGWVIIFTTWVLNLSPDIKDKVIELVKDYRDFTPDNDPYWEHDFGSFYINDIHIYWKIDYYDINMIYGSEDPSNEDMTTRVLTIMLADEY